MSNLTVICPYCYKEFDISSKDLNKHFAKEGGRARSRLSKEELSRIGKLGASKRWKKNI